MEIREIKAEPTFEITGLTRTQAIILRDIASQVCQDSPKPFEDQEAASFFTDLFNPLDNRLYETLSGLNLYKMQYEVFSEDEGEQDVIPLRIRKLVP